MLAALGATTLHPVIARATDGGPATATNRRGDIAILRQALALHPGLYRYNSPRQIADRLDRLEIDFVAAQSLEAQYLLLAHFLATIRCGHSYANFFNQKEAVASALFDRPTRLPFQFRWIGTDMIVLREPTGVLPPGTTIRRINGVPAQAILRQLMPYVRADGHNDAKRISLLEVRGDQRLETFDVFHGLLFGEPTGGLHQVDVRTPDGGEKTVALPATGIAARRAMMALRATDKTAALWNWQMRPDSVAVLTMPSWGVYDSKWDWRGWLDARLASLGGAKGLVIDLRDNEGGEDCGDSILARLATSDLQRIDYAQKLRFRRTPPEIDRYLDTWDSSFRTLGVGGADLPGGFIARPGESASSRIAAVAPRLTLPVAALIGPVNSSATFQFAATAKASGLVRLFGSATGGNQRGINGGCFFFVRLPACGLEFDLPLVGTFPRAPQPDAGLAPHVAVAASAADIAAGRDPVLATAIDWAVRG